MTSFYTPQDARRYRLRARASLAVACALTAVAWLVCAFLCARVRTANAGLLFRWVMGLSTGSGWIAIVLLTMVFRPAQAESRHMAGILKEQAAEEYEGVLTLLPDEFQIPRGIRVRRGTLDDGNGTVSLRLDARFTRQLPAGQRLRVRAVRQFITGFEVLHEDH